MIPAAMLRTPIPESRLGAALCVLTEATARFESGDGAILAAVRQDSRLPMALDAIASLADEPRVHSQIGNILNSVFALCGAVLSASWRDSHHIPQAALPWMRLLYRLGGISSSQIQASIPPFWHAIWSATDRLERFVDFDPLVELIAATARADRDWSPTHQPVLQTAGQPYRVAYVTPFIEWRAGTSSGTHSLAMAHARNHPDHQVRVLVLKDDSEELREHYRDSSANLHFNPDPVAAFRQLAEDGVEAALVDNYFPVTIAALARRIAPVQVVLDMTHVYGNLPEVDWWFIGSGDYRRRLGLNCDNVTAVAFDRTLESIPAPDRKAAEAIRAELGWQDDLVLGFIGRIIKFSPELAELAAATLRRNPEAKLMLCGSGDSNLAAALTEQPDLRGRIALFNQVVDVSQFGPAIDIFLDSHPFTGGETCREVASYGVPIVTMNNPDFALLIAQGRDPDLVATDSEDYLGKVDRLAADPQWRRLKAARSAEIARRRCDMTANLETIVDRVEKLIDLKRT